MYTYNIYLYAWRADVLKLMKYIIPSMKQKWIEVEVEERLHTQKKTLFVNSNFNQRYNYYMLWCNNEKKKRFFLGLLVLKFSRRSTFTLTEIIKSLILFFFPSFSSYTLIKIFNFNHFIDHIPLNTPVSSNNHPKYIAVM